MFLEHDGITVLPTGYLASFLSHLVMGVPVQLAILTFYMHTESCVLMATL